MDDLVKAAIAKWPNVPHCLGWLGLDGRGNWYLRDDAAQAAGPFALAAGELGAASKGSLLRHDRLIDFIQRNCGADGTGQWFFQNGPQRVYLELEHTPFIWRLQPDRRVLAHTGVDAGPVLRCLMDEHGLLYLLTPLGLGLVHTSDMVLAAYRVESGAWRPEDVLAVQLPALFGFVRSPQRAQAARAGAPPRVG